MSQELKPMKNLVVHCKREAFDMYIGRPSRFGNPFKLTDESRRVDVIGKYKRYLWERIQNEPEFREAVRKLHGKILGCWCSPKLCHGHVLASAAAYLELQAVKGSKER